MVMLALELGASFVARGFSGDKEQLVPMIRAAVAHQGAAFIDVLSPCVAFNNHPGSTKSYDFVREHNEAVNALDIMLPRAEITTDYAPGTVQDVVQHDGRILRLRKLHADYDASDRTGAVTYLQRHRQAGEIVTGVLYVRPDAEDLHQVLNTVDVPLNELGERELVPGAAALEKFNASLR
jgi:2-oxoglutarate ferredoxin oxidoreductase subunit beta